jgi:hypothetical protein
MPFSSAGRGFATVRKMMYKRVASGLSFENALTMDKEGAKKEAASLCQRL